MYEPLNEDKEDLGESVYAQLAKESESIVTAADIQGELVFIDELIKACICFGAYEALKRSFNIFSIHSHGIRPFYKFFTLKGLSRIVV